MVERSKSTNSDPIDAIVTERKLMPLIKGLNLDKTRMVYLALRNEMTPVQKGSVKQRIVGAYFTKTLYCKPCGSFDHPDNPVINNIWSISRKIDEDEYRWWGYDKKGSTLLWHGTNSCNVPSILYNGLGNHPLNHFGTGIYFADRVHKSILYTDRCPSSGYLFVCQVATGKMLKSSYQKPVYRTPVGYDCVKTLGQWQPKPTDVAYFNIDSGYVVAPWGVSEHHPEVGQKWFTHNEYCIFTPRRILVKYLVQFSYQKA